MAASGMKVSFALKCSLLGHSEECGEEGRLGQRQERYSL